MLIGQIAKKNAIVIKYYDTINEAIDLFNKHGIRHLPVIDDQIELVGIISATDIIRSVYNTSEHGILETQVVDIMTEEVITIQSDQQLYDALLLMFNLGISSVVILSDQSIDGIITNKDFVFFDDIWQEFDDDVMNSEPGIGKPLIDQDIINEEFTIWQVTDKILQTGRKQILIDRTEEPGYAGVITLKKILLKIEEIFKDTEFDRDILHTTPVSEFEFEPVLRQNIPITIARIRELMKIVNVEAVTLFDEETPVKIITQEDLVGYLATKSILE